MREEQLFTKLILRKEYGKTDEVLEGLFYPKQCDRSQKRMYYLNKSPLIGRRISYTGA